LTTCHIAIHSMRKTSSIFVGGRNFEELGKKIGFTAPSPQTCACRILIPHYSAKPLVFAEIYPHCCTIPPVECHPRWYAAFNTDSKTGQADEKAENREDVEELMMYVSSQPQRGKRCPQ
jgi:hypothetical protein